MLSSTSWRPKRRISAIALVMVTLAPAGLGGQRSDISWDKDARIDPQDREAIIALAKRAGLQEVATISSDRIEPGGCRFLRVASPVTVSGRRRTWHELMIRSSDWNRCLLDRRATIRGGRWVVVSDLSAREEWTIRDGSWRINVYLQPGIPLEEAEFIVRALRRKTYINLLSDDERKRRLLSGFDPNNISRITRERHGTGIKVETGTLGGLILTVVNTDGRVGLSDVTDWIV